MDTELANKIAAGEVVQSLVSVVKELVENSIDAKSDEIKIELKESGFKEIKVIDNGIGMDKEDAKKCFLPHASSKLTESQELYHIKTLGFRGEALPSIASISEVMLITCDGTSSTTIHIKGGSILKEGTGDYRKGTTISVRSIFYNTPARLKHLSSLYTELANICEYVNKISLSYPNIRFTLINDEKELFKTDGSNNLLKVINNIYGINVTKKMVEIKGENDDYAISGYITYPEITRSTRSHITTLVNNRVVKNQEINKCINDSYHTFKPDDKYPIVVLKIEVDPTLIDINIHPTKADIKFSKIDTLKELINKTIKSALCKINLIPDAHVKEDSTLDNLNKIEFNPVFENEKFFISEPNFNKEQKSYVTPTLDLDDLKEVPEKTVEVPPLYPIGIVHGTYIICENELGMYMIDQHAAKERVNYELYLEKLNSGECEKQGLLIPVTLELTNNEFVIIKENIDILNNIGVTIEEFGINTIKVTEHPTWLKDVEQTIPMIIDLVIKKEKNFELRKFNDHLAATLACKASIKGNTYISLDEAKSLIEELRSCKNAYSCPHGRPTIIHYSTYELEKMFKRAN